MTDQEKRIKLAEFMGWHDIQTSDKGDNRMWGYLRDSVQAYDIPDPHHDLNDAMACVKKVFGQHYILTVIRKEKGYYVVFGRNDVLMIDDNAWEETLEAAITEAVWRYREGQ